MYGKEKKNFIVNLPYLVSFHHERTFETHCIVNNTHHITQTVYTSGVHHASSNSSQVGTFRSKVYSKTALETHKPLPNLVMATA
jgi:hypothetical protein